MKQKTKMFTSLSFWAPTLVFFGIISGAVIFVFYPIILFVCMCICMCIGIISILFLVGKDNYDDKTN